MVTFQSISRLSQHQMLKELQEAKQVTRDVIRLQIANEQREKHKQNVIDRQSSYNRARYGNTLDVRA